MFKVLFCAIILFCSFSFALSQQTAEERLAGFLKAMGGREAWAEVKGVHLTVTHFTTTVRLPFKNVIWNDFETPRHRIEASNSEYKRTLIWQKSGENWLKRDSEIAQKLTEEQEKTRHVGGKAIRIEPFIALLNATQSFQLNSLNQTV
jgi:hypothetical protein